MLRRRFLTTSAGLSAGFGLAPLSSAFAQDRSFDPQPGTWHAYDLTTRVEIARVAGPTRVWVPVPSVNDSYQQAFDTQWRGNASKMQLVSDGKYGASMLYAEFPASQQQPVLEVTTRVRTQNRATVWKRRDASLRLDSEDAFFWTRPTDLIPTDGIVRDTARRITRGQTGEVQKVRAIYDWVVANTYRDLKVAGCGIGDIKAMLVSGNMGGKCADINALFVGLVRSIGIPARDIYGIRVAPSSFGYKQLGASQDVSKAQHCRAEAYLTGYGWTAMDPADVGKVMRLETADWIKDSSNPIVRPVKAALFGGWEGNWVGYNWAHDVSLPGSNGSRIGFCMYPQAENDKGRFDSLDPASFRYSIHSAPAALEA